MDEEGLKLWKLMTRDVKRLSGRKYAAPECGHNEKDEPTSDKDFLKSENALSAQPVSKRPKKNKSGLAQKSVSKTIKEDAAFSRGADTRTLQKLKRGQIPVEASLDLHGMGRAQARDAVKRFLNAAQMRGARCVLIITGKGKRQFSADYMEEFSPDRGILRRMVPEWLDEVDFHPLVISYASAKPKDGGGGALYVLIRRVRV